MKSIFKKICSKMLLLGLLISGSAFACITLPDTDQNTKKPPTKSSQNPRSVTRGENLVMCPMDAMMCPNGESVGRSGKNCEFKCPVGTAEKKAWNKEATKPN